MSNTFFQGRAKIFLGGLPSCLRAWFRVLLGLLSRDPPQRKSTKMKMAFKNRLEHAFHPATYDFPISVKT